MSRILACYLLLHWAVVFSALSLLGIFAGSAGAMDSLSFLGLSFPEGGLGLLHPATVTGITTTMFVFCAVLFWWALLSVVLSFVARVADIIDVVAAAFGAATMVVTLVVAYAATSGMTGILQVAATHFAALAASYVAIRSECWIGQQAAQDREADDLRLAARINAINASNSIALPRFAVAEASRHSRGL
jgi:hypothetical protein